jgi:SWI/SNF-related matrix-associated actin-dependent regulator of chromatin subfamily D
MYKTRLDIQENLILPTPKIKALLRTHIFSSYCTDTKAEDEMLVDSPDHEWVLRIQGKIMPVLEEQPGGYYRKFSHFFNKIEIEFDPNNTNGYEKIEWNKTPNSDSDGFDIRRSAKFKDEIKLKIFFYLNYITPEYQLSNELAKLLGIKQETRPRILYHIWQYIKINSLQDNDSPNMIINNRELQRVFKCEKMDITSITARLTDHIKLPDPIIIDYSIQPVSDWNQNQKLYDFIVNIDDPHFLDISNFLSNSDSESILFPKSLFYIKNDTQKNEKSQSTTEVYYNKLQDYDRNISDLIEKLKKHKYKYDFYEAFEKDPISFINNFLIQQNSLLKIMQDEASIVDSRWDYNPAQYYKDYEVIFFLILGFT